MGHFRPRRSGLGVQVLWIHFRVYICTFKFSGLAHKLFIFFCMMLGVHKAYKLTKPDFWKKISFSQIWAKRAQNVPKMVFSQFWRKSSSLMCAFYCLQWKSLWSSIILRKSQVREKSGSRVMAQIALSQSDCKNLWSLISLKGFDASLWFFECR